ncbi:MAG: hypothetical protein J2P56_10160, partial [Verrucomicrobia bacterium]|nr:hypothetical protein [Verrucomicrobiota bacterium]
MPPSTLEAADLLDLKLLPAWVKEPVEPNRYADAEGEPVFHRSGRHQRGPTRRGRRSTPGSDKSRAGTHRPARKAAKHEPGRHRSEPRGHSKHRARDHKQDRPAEEKHLSVARTPITIRFLPYSPAFENVVAQIKSGSVAYSLYALARLFLEKPERYDVRLTATAESPLYCVGDNDALSLNREFLERNAFRFAQSDFYRTEVTESEPIKGNFSNVARCRLSGTLLGPTNHHNYQLQLRSLYEQRFSRRMSFADYQRQIEIVSDAALIERWKEEVRRVTTYTTSREETPLTFASATEAERHFRSHYLEGLIQGLQEVTIGGVMSRRLQDKILNRAVEDAWVRETRSPSGMMQELAGRFRQDGLHVFRHRRGMLFVSPIRTRAFVHEQAGVSASVNAILEGLAGTAVINRKQFFEKMIGDVKSEDAEPRKLALASDLRWLINEGYVIEFNDGSLDLPRGKVKPPASAEATADRRDVVVATDAGSSLPNESPAEPKEQSLALAIWPAIYSPTILSE